MTIIPVPFTILADSGVQEGGTLEAPYAKVKFKVKWANRIVFANFVCGTTIGGPGSIVRTTPLPYPPSPNMYATRTFEIEPLGKLRRDDGAGWVTYDHAVVTITFEIPDYGIADSGGDPSGQPWTTTTIDTGGEIVTLPESSYKFADGTVVAAPVGRVIPQATVTFKRHWVPYLPVSEMLGLIGKVNDAPVVIGNFTAPAESMLFLGGPNNRESDTAGGMSQSVEYKAAYKPTNWNKFIKPGNTGTGGTFQYIQDAAGNKVYQLGSFSSLP